MSGILPSHHDSSPPALTVPFAWNERAVTAVLPMPLTSFVGREREINTVADLLRRPDVRLLTLTGTGGIGKTRLALRVVEGVANEYDDGVALVVLAAIRDPDLVLPAVAQVLNVPDAAGQPLVDRLQAFLADRNQLLVLDNVEHLLDAAVQFVNMLANSPGLTILCTSRIRLGLSAEHVFTLPPLTTVVASHLFEDRVRALEPTFALNDDLAATVDAICDRLDRLPLAIELAAARTNVLPPRALLARLAHRLDLLTDGPRDMPARMRDMRGAIAWSHDLLMEQGQVLFRRLGVFIGGFTLEAAQEIGGEQAEVFDIVSALVAACLVNPTDGVGDEPRFTMLETIREYAIPHYDGPELRLYNNRVDIELDNCRAAMTWTLDHDEAEIGVRLAGALWRVWWYSQVPGGKPLMDRVAEGLSWCERTVCRLKR